VKALTEKHLAIFRRHMVDVITIHADLSSEETGKSALDERVLDVMRELLSSHFRAAAGSILPSGLTGRPSPISFVTREAAKPHERAKAALVRGASLILVVSG
jgi:protein-L-isoaspartate(D-aspartate) O-methyltransferase